MSTTFNIKWSLMFPFEENNRQILHWSGQLAGKAEDMNQACRQALEEALAVETTGAKGKATIILEVDR